MRYQELLEANHPDIPYYHGTPKEYDAVSIMRTGLRPPELKAHSNTNLQPQAGYVYLTPFLRYALNYAMGFHMEEQDRLKLRLPYEGNEKKLQWLTKNGSYAYMFVVNASTITTDLHPDEDAVGALYDSAISGHIHFFLESFLPEEIFEKAKADPLMLERFVAAVQRIVSPTTLMKLRNAEWASDKKISWTSKIGKIAVRKLDPAMKSWLIQIGCHAGHYGPLKPDECWRFERVKLGWLEPDASNFFDLSTRIA